MSQKQDTKIAQAQRRHVAKITNKQIDVMKLAVRPKKSWMPERLLIWMIRQLFTADFAILVYDTSMQKMHMARYERAKELREKAANRAEADALMHKR